MLDVSHYSHVPITMTEEKEIDSYDREINPTNYEQPYPFITQIFLR